MAARARLFCKTGEFDGASFEIGDQATIGRDKASEIALDVKFISRRHARLYFDAERACYVIEDLRSRNGTAVNGTRIREPAPLPPLSVITFAEKLDFIFHVRPAEPES